MMLWIIGLSGSGKTTFADMIRDELAAVDKSTLVLDGDKVRELFGDDAGHGIEGRRLSAERLLRLCKFIDIQGFSAICPVISIFPDLRERARQELSHYSEVYLKADMVELQARDSKGLYSKFNEGEIVDVVGKDIPFPEPKHADYIFENSGTRYDLQVYARELARELGTLF